MRNGASGLMWAKFDCNGADASAEKDLALPGDYWAQADIQIPAGALVSCSDGDLFGGSASVLTLLRSSDHGLTAGIRIIDNDYPHGDAWSWYTDSGVANNDTGVAFAAATTFTLKAHWDGTHVEWYIDGTLVATNTVAAGSPTAGIIIGGYISEECECEWYFVANVKVGTSDGGTDIFADDFSSGDFFNWDSTTGSCAVVTTPTDDCGAPPPPPGVYDTIDVDSGPQDLATWSAVDDDSFVINELSVVKFSDSSFWVAEIHNEISQVRHIAADGTQTVYPVIDKISAVFEGGEAIDLILGTDGVDVWLAMLHYDTKTFVDQACVDHPVPDSRDLAGYSMGVAIFATSAPSGDWVDFGSAFYILGEDGMQTANRPDTFGELPPLFDDSTEPINLQAAFTACASDAEEGFFHVMWSELGYAGNFNPCDYADGVPSGAYTGRLSYSRWTNSGPDTQVDLLSSTENWGIAQQADQGGAPLVADAIAICQAVIKNDTGSPIAFINQLGSYSGLPVVSTGQFIPETEIRMWDMSSPTAGVPSELQNSSGVVPDDLDQLLFSVLSSAFNTSNYLGPPDILELHCTAPYDDALLSGTPVYLIGVQYQSTVAEQRRTFILRVPCDGSDSFDYLDGDTGAGTGITTGAGEGDFVSETRNVWWPGFASGGVALMNQYDRICRHAWLRDFESPDETGVNCPRGIDLTDDLITFVSYDNAAGMNTLTQQIILREALPCSVGVGGLFQAASV